MAVLARIGLRTAGIIPSGCSTLVISAVYAGACRRIVIVAVAGISPRTGGIFGSRTFSIGAAPVGTSRRRITAAGAGIRARSVLIYDISAVRIRRIPS